MYEYSYNSGEYICLDCIDNYAYCEECECYEYAEKIDEYVDEYGDSHFVCSDCKNNVIYNCDHCGCEYYYTGKFENIACCEECNEALNEAEDEEQYVDSQIMQARKNLVYIIQNVHTMY